MSEIKAKSQSWQAPLVLLTAAFLFYIIITFDFSLAYQFLAGFLMLICSGSFFTLLVLNATNNNWPNGFQTAFAAIILGAGAILYMYRNGYLYGKKVIDATFLDDRSRMDMHLYEDGHYIITSSWILGSETFTGTYQRQGNNINFTSYPVIDNDFIDKKVTIKNGKIYFRQTISDTSFYYFKINN